MVMVVFVEVTVGGIAVGNGSLREIGQLGNVRRDPPCLVAGVWIRRGTYKVTTVIFPVESGNSVFRSKFGF
jgi:hypothetical protein